MHFHLGVADAAMYLKRSDGRYFTAWKMAARRAAIPAMKVCLWKNPRTQLGKPGRRHYRFSRCGFVGSGRIDVFVRGTDNACGINISTVPGAAGKAWAVISRVLRQQPPGAQGVLMCSQKAPTTARAHRV